MTGRRLADWEPLTPAERRVIEGLGTGHVTPLWPDGTPAEERLPPPDAGDDRCVRASLLRWLALGAPGDETVNLHEHGLRIAGALVASDGKADPFSSDTTPGLDLEGCTLDRDLSLFSCRFEHAPVLRGARLQTLVLNRSHLPGLRGDGLRSEGGVVLDGVRATGEVRLLGAQIGGDLDCERARFENAGGKALAAHGLRTEGNVFLNGMRAIGEVGLVGTRVGGNLECNGARFANAGGNALGANRAQVSGALFWRNGSKAIGRLDLSAAEFGHINDDPVCWPGPGDLVLDRCRYGAFTGEKATTDAKERIRWLGLQDHETLGTDFLPSAWEQCAKVLREMGHPEDARAILIEKERLQREDRRKPARTPQRWRRALLRLWDGLLGVTISYGHRPMRALIWLFVSWSFGVAVFTVAAGQGALMPNSSRLLRAPEWMLCDPEQPARFHAPSEGRIVSNRSGGHRSQMHCFLAQPEGMNYPRFNTAVYAADVLLPVVALEQQGHWVPNPRTGWGVWREDRALSPDRRGMGADPARGRGLLGARQEGLRPGSP